MESEIKDLGNLNQALSFLLDENYCVLLAKNFEELFLFWRFSRYKVSMFEKGVYQHMIRVKLLNESGKTLIELPAKWDCGGIYLRIPFEDILCYAEIYSARNTKEERLCVSAAIKVPSFSSEPSLGSREYGL